VGEWRLTRGGERMGEIAEVSSCYWTENTNGCSHWLSGAKGRLQLVEDAVGMGTFEETMLKVEHESVIWIPKL
jgi:hypothetical protein